MSAAHIRHSIACAPQLYKEAVDQAYSEGYSAYDACETHDHNPYMPLTAEARAWREGFNDNMLHGAEGCMKEDAS